MAEDQTAIYVRLPTPLVEKLDSLRELDRRSRPQEIRVAIEEFIERREAEDA